MAKQSATDATDSALGYYFQAIYALVVLYNAGDAATVSVETRDDIDLRDKISRLSQIKHSTGKPDALTEKNDGFWNTLGIWMKYLSEPDLLFVFVTCADLQAGNPLIELRGHGPRQNAIAILEQEAKRVLDEVAAERAKQSKNRSKGPLPFAERRAVCEAFLQLQPKQRHDLLERVTVLDGNFNVTALNSQIESLLTAYRRDLRKPLAERLIEWWDRRVAKSLYDPSLRRIDKDELIGHIHSLLDELRDDNLPNDFSLERPGNLSTELGGVMEEQIRLVNGGPERINRAALARWRAREQRNRWIREQIGIAPELDRFDNALLQFWGDRHGPACDDCSGKSDGDKATTGLGILDWSHLHAFQEVPQPRAKWTHAFLTQGTYQQLAEELKVGWHPDFRALVQPRSSPASPKKGRPKKKPRSK